MAAYPCNGRSDAWCHLLGSSDAFKGIQVSSRGIEVVGCYTISMRYSRVRAVFLPPIFAKLSTIFSFINGMLF